MTRGWRKLYKKEFHKLIYPLHITQVIKRRMMRNLGAILFAKPQGN
jgi:hypothetical protein